jgi:hypothetical protein
LQKGPWKRLQVLQSGPSSWSEGRKKFDRPNPATVIAGGEVRGARNLQWVKAHLIEGLGARDADRRSSSELDKARRWEWAAVRSFWWGIGDEVRRVSFTGLKASRPLIRVLVINDNGLWINDFIWDNEYRLIHGWKRFGCEHMEFWRWWAKLGLKAKV